MSQESEGVKKAFNFKKLISQNSSKNGKKSIVSKFLEMLSNIFSPIVMPLAGAGMIKAMLVILTTFNLMSDKSSTYAILAAAGNSVFYFLPLLLAYSSAKVFNCNQFIGFAIVGALLEPNFLNLITSNGVKVDFMGLPAILMNYSSTVIPAIFAIYVYSKFEKHILKRFVPKSLEVFLLPMLGLLVMVPLTVLVIGPIGGMLGDGLGAVVNYVSRHNGLLAGVIIGGSWTFICMVGAHWGVAPIMISNLAKFGYDIIKPMVAASIFSNAGVCLGVFLRAKDKETKSLALSCMIPILVGGTIEPTIYGLSVRFKRPFIAQTIAGAVAGGFIGLMQVKCYVYVFASLTSIPAFFGNTLIYYLIGIAIAFFLSGILTFIFGLGEEGKKLPEEQTGENGTVQQV